MATSHDDDGEEASQAPELRRVEKWKKYGRLSGKFSSPSQIRQIAQYVCNKLDALSVSDDGNAQVCHQ